MAIKKKVVTKAMLEKSLSSTMKEAEALSLSLAQANEAKDMLTDQMENVVESSLSEMAALQEKIMFLTFEIERKDGLLDYIQSKFLAFMFDWKELRGKPWKRFWKAVVLLGDIMDIMTSIMSKLDDELSKKYKRKY